MKGLVVLFITMLTFSVAKADVLKFGIVPQQSASSLAKVWVPLTALLSKMVGEQIRFSTAPNIPEFEKRVADGDYDIVYLNPYHYTVFSKSIGMRAIARQKDKRIQGIIVVNKDSNISSLDMLKGAEIAFPAPAAFAATVLPKANLIANNIPFSSQYVSSHDSVYSGVEKKLFVAGGGIDRTFSTLKEEQSKKLKIIWRSKGYTPHAFAVASTLPDATMLKIQKALIDMDKSPEGKTILNKLGFKKGIMMSVDSDWDDVRALNIDLIAP